MPLNMGFAFTDCMMRGSAVRIRSKSVTPLCATNVAVKKTLKNVLAKWQYDAF